MLFYDCGTNVGELKNIFADLAAAETLPGVLACSLNSTYTSNLLLLVISGYDILMDCL